MKITIPVEIEVEKTYGSGKHAYVVAECRGGIMEDPEFHYHNYQLIRADSADEAVRAYNFINDCQYFYGCVMHQVE